MRLAVVVVGSLLVTLQGPVGVEGDQCYSYAGGSVYPQETTAKGHSLQWTKAMSKEIT